MKLIRFGDPGREKPGLQLEDGTRLDASAFGSDYDEAFFGGSGLARLREWSAPTPPAPRASRPARGWVRPCAAEQDRLHRPQLPRSRRGDGRRDPKEPVIFFKATSSLVGPDDDLVTPRGRRRWTGRSSSPS
jgi:hypothetical protein